jgi:hypothetical protein
MEDTMVVDSIVKVIDMSFKKNLFHDLTSISKFSIVTYNFFLEQLFLHLNVWGFN